MTGMFLQVIVSWTEILYTFLYGVYFIVRSGTGPWARVHSFRIPHGLTDSRGVGPFELYGHL